MANSSTSCHGHPEDATDSLMDASGGISKPSCSGLTRTVEFSSGNPRIEVTRGVMRLFDNPYGTPNSVVHHLPEARSPFLCVLDVSNHTNYADFCQFCGSFVQHILEMRIVRNDGADDCYSVLIRFSDQNSADSFYRYFNQKPFSSLEEEICNILFTMDVQYMGSSGHPQTSAVGLTELPNCPVCLEKLDNDIGGVLTTICNHSFHCACISNWTDSSCPVCRYCLQQHEKSTCSVCATSENLWMCVICGFVGCGRYKEGHAIRHWKETQHCYSLELETQRVWDYVGDNYVHRLIQSKTDGKLVEFNSHCRNADDACGNCECSGDTGVSEVLFNSKVEAIVDEYNELLTSQLENQRKYFSSLLLEAKEGIDREISEAAEKVTNVKLQKLHAKLQKCYEEKQFLDDINENLLKNQEMWRKKLMDIEERERTALRERDGKIQDLEEQLKELMMGIEAHATDAGSPKEEAIQKVHSESSSRGRTKQMHISARSK